MATKRGSGHSKKRGGAGRAPAQPGATTQASARKEWTVTLSADAGGNVRGRISGGMLQEVNAEHGDEGVFTPNQDGYSWTFFVRRRGAGRKRAATAS
jgi:hypothetical protein